MWKTLLLILPILPSIFSAHAQKRKKSEPTLFVFDKDWKPCKTENAHYLIAENKLDDTTYEVKYYHFSGPMISVETYRNEQRTALHGLIAFYDSKGRIDSIGYSYDGKKHGSWTFFNDSMVTIRTEKYDHGKLVEKKNAAELKAEREEMLAKGYVLNPGEKEARFKDGENEWRTYLGKNMKFPKRAQNLGIGGKIRVRFMIDTEGNTKDIWLDQSIEYSLDEEAIRLIRDSPKWSPAVKEGKNANAWRIQPITFANPN
jgi:periplasmic protein TonB